MANEEKSLNVSGEIDKGYAGKAPVKIAKQDGPGEQEPQCGKPEPLGLLGKTTLGLCFVALAIILCYLLYAIWPTAKVDANGNIPNSIINLFGYHFSVSSEINLILLVMVVGAIGSYVHTATSFADFVGNRRIYRSWVWYYVLRVFIGVALALIFYFVIRGGLLSAGSDTKDLNTFGIAAVSALVGMFSKPATDKLAEVFDTIFKTVKEEERGDALNRPVPKITALEPDNIQQGSPEVTMKISGTGFVPESMVKINGVERCPKYISSEELSVKIPHEDLVSLGKEITVAVFNSPPGGGTSNEFKMKTAP